MENVEAGMANAAALQGGDEGILVDQRRACGIGENHARLHARKFGGSEEPARLVIEREIHRNDVGSRQQFFEANEWRARSWQAVPGDRVHAEPAAMRKTSLPMPPRPITPSVLPRS